MDEKKWFVIKTKPRAEKRVAQRLLDLGIENYLPLHRQLKVWHDRKKYVEQVLFTSYVFVLTTEKLRREAFMAAGVVKYLFVCGKIAVITEKEIEQIKVFCTLDEIKITSENFEIGDEVEIISGNLIGLRGQLLVAVPNGRSSNKLKINLPALGCFAVINIDSKEVKKIRIEV